MVLDLLLQTLATITHQNIVNLLKVKVDMVVVVSILTFMLFSFPLHFFLTHIKLLLHMLRKVGVAFSLVLGLLYFRIALSLTRG